MTAPSFVRALIGAAAAASAAALARWALTPLLGDGSPFLMFMVAAALVTRYGSFLAAALTVVCSLPLAALLFLGGPVTRRAPELNDLTRALLFVAVTWLFIAVTARVRRLQHAQEGEAKRLRAVLHSIGDGVIVSDGHGLVVTLNPEAERLTGWTSDAARGHSLASVFTIVDSDTRTPAVNPALQAVRDKAPVRLADRTLLVAKDGGEWPIDDVATPVLDADGRVTGSVLVFRDVTARRQAESALRDSEQELADFFDHATIGLHWAGPDGVILRANQAELDLLGYSSNDYIGRHVAEFHEDPQALAALMARLAGGETVRDFPARLKCRDGRRKDVLISASARWSGGRIAHTRAFTLDVTDRKRADEATAHLAAIVESSDDAVLSKTLDGRILTWNAGAQHMFGYTAEEAVGRSIDLLLTDEARAVEAGLLARVAAGERVDSFETTRVAKDGERLDVSLTLSAIRNQAGAIIGASSIARDIRRHKQLEQSLRDADRRKDEFLAVLAHELRNPLAPIWNSVATMRMAQFDERAVRHATAVIDRQSRQMARLLDDLMDVSRITRGKLHLQRAPVTLRDVLDLALETVRPHVDAAQQRLAVSLPDATVPLDADAMRLAQVFANLISNASKYSGEGSTIRLSARLDAASVVVAVADDGIGIPAESLSSIFEMFSQASQALAHARGGLGIGLSLVRGLVELHGGQVTAASGGAGRGSTFEVRLPVAVPAPAPRVAPALAGESRAAYRIVIADDNRDGADTLAMVLRAYGHEVVATYDGADVIDEVRAFRPDVVLLDLGMPHVNGYEAARRIRATPEGQKLVLVALTGWGQQKDRDQTRDAGFDAHLVKPVDCDDIQALVQARMAR